MPVADFSGPLRLRFSLRSLFVVVTICCFSLGWLWSNISWILERRGTHAISGIKFEGRTSAPWSLRILGEHGVKRITICWLDVPCNTRSFQIVDPRIHQLGRIFPEAEIVDGF